MNETQTTGQNGNSEQEFEYIELEDGEELPEGYEYEYVEVPADDVSEMDVVNRPHPFEHDDVDDMESEDDSETKKEAPFPSFLQAEYDGSTVNVSDVAEQQIVEDKNENVTQSNVPMVEVSSVGSTDENAFITSPQNNEEIWLPQSGDVSPTDGAVKEDVHFLNNYDESENWQEDSRATVDLDEVKADASGIQFQKNTISSMNVNDYIEPEATLKTKDVAVTDVPEAMQKTKELVSVEKIAENVAPAHELPDSLEEHLNEDVDNSLDLENETSLDELLQEEVVVPQIEDTSSVNEVFLADENKEIPSKDDKPLHISEVNLDNDINISEKTENAVPMEENTLTAVSQNDVRAESLVSSSEVVVNTNVSPAESHPSQMSENVNQTENLVPAEQNLSLPKSDVSEENIVNVKQDKEGNVWDDIALDTRSSDEHWEQLASEAAPAMISALEENSTFQPQDSDEKEKTEKAYKVDEIVEKNIPSEPSSTSLPQEQSVGVYIGEDSEFEQINPQILDFDVVQYQSDEIEKAEFCSRVISKQNGVQSFKASREVSDILLTDIDFSQNELKFWNLVLYQKSIVPLEKKVSELTMPRSTMINRYVSVIQGGNSKIDLYNETDLKIINASHACVAVNGNFICGDFEANSGVVVDDFVTLPLIDFIGKKISFKKPASGLLTGPNGCVVFFFGLQNLWIPNSDVAAIDAEKLQYKISKWYSGTARDKYFEFSSQSESSEFIGNADVDAIHVNVSNTSYGWNVAFDNGITMNLRDLREYQTRFGKIPSENGIISYGQKTLTFKNVKRIVVYEAAQYFFYN